MELNLQPGVVITNMHVRDVINYVSIEIIIKKNHAAFQIEIQLYRKFGTVVRPFLVKFEQDFCEFLGMHNSSILYRMLPLEKMRTYGNFYDPCPISVLMSYQQ